MKQPVPKATPEAIAQDKAEIESRGSLGTIGKVMENFHRGPDVSEATKVGEPTLVDPKQASAPDMVRAANASVLSILQGAGMGDHVAVEQVTDGSAPAENAPVPRSDAAPGTSAPAPDAAAASDASGSGGTPAETTAGTEMKNDLPPAAGTGPASAPAPTQVNDLANGSSSSSAPAASSSSAQQQAPPANTNTESSSKKKKKRHLLPF